MLAHNLQGKGIWIRRVYECENGDIARIVDRAREAGFTHLLVKTSDGDDPYNLDHGGRDYAAELIPRLREAGIDVWAWHYLYGDPPSFKDQGKDRYWELEAQQAVSRCRTLQAMGLQGYVIDAEGEYERIPDRSDKAATFCRILRDGLPDLPIGLASWKWPSYHSPFPWTAFRENIDVDMPQVYWISAHDPAEQLRRSVDEYAGMAPELPFVAAGPAFFEHNWRPTPEDIASFFQEAVHLNLPAANLWAWDHLGLRGGESYNPSNLNFTAEWEAAAAFTWPGVAPVPSPSPEPPPPPTPPEAGPIERFFEALSEGDLDTVMRLYAPRAAHINRDRAEQNLTRIRDFYAGMLSRLGSPTFVIRETRDFSGSTRVAWSATLPDGRIVDGEDTINLSPEGKIRYHTTTFNLNLPLP